MRTYPHTRSYENVEKFSKSLGFGSWFEVC